jgi:hypothetical protein
VDVADGVAYVGDRRHGLMIVDVSDPEEPVELGPVVPGAVYDVEVRGGLAYAADADAGLLIIDVSDPSAPEVLATLPVTGRTTKLAISEGFAYVKDHPYGVRVVDISNPTAPLEVGLMELTTVTNVEIAGDHAYVTGGFNAMRIFDISDPAAPSPLGAIDVVEHFYAYDVELRDDVAYLVGEDALRVIDVSDPATPVETGFISMPSSVFDCKLVDDLAFVAAQGSRSHAGLRVIDIADPRVPKRLAELETSGPVDNVEVAGDVAYVVARGRDLRMIDVSEPSAPTEIGSLPYGSGGGSRDVEVAAGIAYLVGHEGGLILVDVADPRSPNLLGTINASLEYLDVEVADGVAFVVNAFVALRTIDVSDPSTPVVLGQWSPGDTSPIDIAVSEDRTTAVILADEALRVVDISDPTDPALVGSLYIGHHGPGDVEVRDGFAYLGTEWGLQVVDISTRATPIKVALLTTRSDVLDVELAGPYAYLASSNFGIRVVDISDPTLPWEVSAHDAIGAATGLSISDQIAFAGYVHLGLGIVAFRPTVLRLGFDIRPWSDTNPINPMSKGVIPVAILGSESFDVADVDATTLTFGPNGAAPVHQQGGHSQDVNDDGLTDLLSHYGTQETGIAVGDTEACVTGEARDGMPLEGCDSINTQPNCGNGFQATLVLPPLVWIGGRMRRLRRVVV